MMLGRYLARGLAGQQNFEEARVGLERAQAQGLNDVQGDLAALPAASPVAAPASVAGAGAVQDATRRPRAAGDAA